MSQQVARVEKEAPQQLATVDNTTAMLSVIERAARDPNVDIDKMERLMQMHERMQARQAKAEFDADMAELQPELPAIGERGKAMVNGQVRYTFALWEDINTAIKPVLMRHGFALTFRTDFTNGITVTGVLSHRGGHREETSITLPSDKSGSKNDVQAVASTVSYGKRYTAGALLNLTSHGEDDDAYAAAGDAAAAADWYAAIDAATTMDELQKVANELKAAHLTGAALRNVRAAWAKRSKEVAK
jgi:hypothetical protein